MQRSPALRDITLRFSEAMANGDAAFITGLLSREGGVLGIGTDPAEWWTGYDDLVRAFRVQMEEMGGGLPYAAGDPQAYEEGPVGWVADKASMHLPGAPAIPVRLTAVFRREEEAWRMVQFHVSVGAGNAETLGKDLTI